MKEDTKVWKRALRCLLTDLIIFSTFLNAGQRNDRLTVLQGLVKNDVGITFNPILLPICSFVVFLHLLPLYIFQRLRKAKKKEVVIALPGNQQEVILKSV